MQPLPDLDFESRLSMLIEREWLLRENRRLKRRLQQAKLQQSACVEDIDYQHPRGLNKAAILELARGQWIKRIELKGESLRKKQKSLQTEDA